MLLPIRCKNPPENIPYVTLGLIVFQALLYFFTADFFVGPTKYGVLADFGLSPDTLVHAPWRLLTAMFLHDRVTRMLPDMLFLWLFGSATEGRLRPLKFIGLYLVSGIVGGLVSVVGQAAIGGNIPLATGPGSIYGLTGAYIYMFPFATVVMFRLSLRSLVAMDFISEWKAQWVVAYYVGYTLLYAIILQSVHLQSRTSFMCMVGGFGAGFLMTLAYRPQRDSEVLSKAQAIRTEVKGDWHKMTLSDLELYLDTPCDNMEIVIAYCWKALVDGGPNGEAKCLKMLNKYKLRLTESGDPVKIASIVLRIPLDTNTLPSVVFLKLGGRLEGVGGFDDAGLCYRRVFDMDKTSKESEVALLRLGRLLETHYQNPDQAREAYSVLVALFPASLTAEHAQQALKRLPPPQSSVPAVIQ